MSPLPKPSLFFSATRKNLLGKNVAVQVIEPGDHSLASPPLVAMEVITHPTWLPRPHHLPRPHRHTVGPACQVVQVRHPFWLVELAIQTTPCNEMVVPLPLPDPAPPRLHATSCQCWEDQKLIVRVEALPA
jgi:hypothetical protein